MTAPLPGVVIVGAGMSGIAMAIALLEAGSDDFVILEKGQRIGGTWRENTYPGLACDVPSAFYAFRTDLNPSWSKLFSPGAEIQAYFEAVVRRRGLERFIRFGVEVVSAEYDDGIWTLTDADGGTYQAPVFVGATGVLHRPRYPDIDGLDTFEGSVFHSARWDHDVTLGGARVGVIGTGSTGVQITVALAEVCDHVVQFQRTPQWVATVPNPPIPALLRRALGWIPGAPRGMYELNRTLFDTITTAVVKDGWRRRAFQGLARRSLRAVDDPELRRQLRPEDEPGCKRLIMSPSYFTTVQQPHVMVESRAIANVEPTGVRLKDGTLHELDVIVLATGFDAQAFLRPMRVTGRGEAELDSVWANGPMAHYTTTVPGFPNLFLILGPNSPIGNTSLVPLAEAQSRYVVRWLERMRERDLASVEPTMEATQRFRERIREDMAPTVWVSGCDSWYLGPDGVPLLWPWSPRRFRQEMRHPRYEDFDETRRP